MPKQQVTPTNGQLLHPLMSNYSYSVQILHFPKKKKKLPQQKNVYSTPAGFSESLDDNSTSSLSVLVQAYEQKGDYKNQIRILRILTTREPKNGVHWMKLAKILRQTYFQTKKIDYQEEFIDITNKILTMDKKYHESTYLEKLKFISSEKETEANKHSALKLIQKLIREFGDKAAYIKLLCKYLYTNQFYLQSLSTCKKAMKRYPNEVSYYIYYALSLKKDNQKKAHLTAAIRKFPNSNLAKLKMGMVLLDQKEYKSAIPYLKKVVEKQPESAETQLGLAQALFHSSQEKASYDHFLHACMLNKSKMLWSFKQARSILHQKNKLKMADFFENGITQCFHKATN